MPQSLAQIYLHIVYSTKHRTPFLREPALRAEVHKYLGGTCRNLDSPSLCVGGIEDHVHILCRLSRTLTVADLVRELKRDSSKWLKPKGQAHLRQFALVFDGRDAFFPRFFGGGTAGQKNIVPRSYG